jgi:UDP-N-acetylglucosamine 3-dehydrogenase
MSKLRIGVIGCGAIAQNVHLKGYHSTPEAEIVALCDIDATRLNEVADKYGVKQRFTDYQELIAKADVDAISVCTPNKFHAEMSIAALNAGKHVLCEKPMATSVEDAKAMVAAAQKSGKTLMVAYSHRFQIANQKAAEMVHAGAIGKPITIRVRFAHNGPYLSWGAKTDWFYRPELAHGGALLDMGIHALDICRFYFGEIKALYATMGTLNKDIQNEDTAILALEFANGALGSIETGWSCVGGPNGIDVFGSKGSIIVDYKTPAKVFLTEPVEGIAAGWTDMKEWAGGGWSIQMPHFVHAVLEGKQPLATGADGLCGVIAATAAYESARTGNKVALS